MGEATKAYLPDGTPAPRMMPCKTKPGEFRPTKSTDVVENGWYFSTTTILGQVIDLGLVRYFEDQIFDAVATSPLTTQYFGNQLAEDPWREGIRGEAAEHRNAAAQIGSNVDGSACCVLEGKSYEHFYSDLTPPEYLDPTVKEIIATLAAIAPLEGWKCQVPFVDARRRYAGTIDLMHANGGRRIFADMKTQGRKWDPNRGPRNGPKGGYKPFTWYDKWPQQLAAYSMGYSGGFGRLVNIAICSKEPGVVQTREWTESETWEAWHKFDALRRYFMVDKYGLEGLKEAA